MFKYLTQRWNQKRGFTLMEVMVVVAILAVIAGIAIPSVINMRKNMKFTERNDYAKAIFMAAQANLTEMRSKGELSLIIPEDGSSKAVKAQADETPPPSTYIYTWNSEASIFDCVLPANSIDSAVRNGQIIIEYNPAAGIVYSVFYYDDDDMDLKTKYASGALTRDEEGRKELLLGYYSVGNIDALDAQALDVYQLASSISFTNSDKALLTISVPSQTIDRTGAIVNIFEKVQGGTSGYTQRMEVALTISGENTNSFTVIGKSALVDATLGETGVVSYTTKTGSSVGAVPIVDFIFTLDSLNENENFKKIIDAASGGTANTTGFQFGDNTAITADITFYPSANDPIVMIESSTIAGINPMFHSLTQNPEYDAEIAKNNVSYAIKPYILAISNARHLQNLEYLAENHSADPTDTFIKQIASIVFVEKQAVTNNPPDVEDSGSADDGSENREEAENNLIQPLSASGTESGNSGNSGNTETETTTEGIAINWATEAGNNAKFSPIDLSKLSYIPEIIGNGVEIKNLKIEKDTGGNTGASIGLFAEMKDVSIEGITLVDPIITNHSAFLTGSNITDAATTGALIGTADGVTIKDCSVVSSAETFCISGNQFVGGLVGYVKGISSFENCEADISVTNINDIAQSTDRIPHILGGLVGYVEGSTATGSTPIAFTNCTTTATITATTATDLGGMAGKAVNASFTGCSTEATVTGADGVLSNIGGLVGEASNVAFINCDSDCEDSGKDGAIILSGPNAGDSNHKQRVGGLVGLATDGNFTNCTSNTGTEVTSAANAVSDVGGMVGYADDVEFASCKSYANVTASQWVDSDVKIPDNNIGGMVGHAADAEFTNVQITMSKLPEYAVKVGGLAGSISNCELKDITVEWDLGNDSGLTTNNITISYFGGIAGTSVNTNTDKDPPMSNVIVRIMDKVGSNAENSAGAFAATQGCKLNDVAVVTKEYGTISGTKAAGVVGTNGSNSNIQYSYFIGNLSGSSNAGFVYNNAHGVVQRCMADITAESTFGFFASNATTSKDTSGKVDVIAQGTIQDCYAWTKTSDHDDLGSYYYGNLISTYFVNNSDSSVVLIDASGNYSEQIYYTLTLKTDVALNALNGSDGTPWVISSDGYPYPRIKDLACPNNYKSPAGNYPFGVLYIEEYSGEYGIGIYEMAYNVGNDYKPVNTLKNATITSTRYELYCITDAASSIKLGDPKAYNSYDDLKTLNEFYSIYPIDSSGAVDFKVGGIEASVNTYYGPVNNNGAYRIRTAAQFGNIGSSGDYAVEFPLTLETDGAIESFSGSISGSVAIDASAISGNLVGTLKGTLSGLTVTGLKAPMVNEISGGTVTGCDVSGKIESGENVGIIAGTMSSGSIVKCNVSGSVSGSGYVGGVVGEVTSGSVSDVNSSVTVNGDVATSGMFVGYASGGEFTNCRSTATTDKLPFGKFATEKLSDATHFASTTVADKLYEENFTNNFTAVTDVPESVTIKVENCTFNNGLPALISGDVYYYKVNTTERQFQLGTTYSLDMDNADGKYATYNDMLALCDEVTEGTPVKTNYFIVNISNYNRLSVSVTSKTVKISTDSTTEEGGTISKEQTQYTFTFTNTSTPAYSFTKELLDDELSRQITSDINGLYVIAKDSDPSACSIKGSQYLIHGGDYGYLTYDPVEGTKWGGAATSENSLWKGSGNGDWWNFMKDDVSVTITATDFNLDSFGGLAKVKFNGTEVPPFDCPSFSVTYVAFYYEYEFLGTAKVVNYPNS